MWREVYEHHVISLITHEQNYAASQIRKTALRKYVEKEVAIKRLLHVP